MEKLFVGMMLGLFVAVAGCGGDDGLLYYEPQISNLQYTPIVAKSEGHTAVTINGSLVFVDPFGDLTFLRVTYQECDQSVPSSQDRDTQLPDLTGVTVGAIQFSSTFTTICPAGTYIADISVMDNQGHQSNKLTSIYELK